MSAPAFWNDPQSPAARLLAPLGWLYQSVTAWRLAQAQPWRAPIPVICIGNLTAGGAGKTPLVRDLARRLTLAGRDPAILSRGYGGAAKGPLRIDPARHRATEVGDEPLLLAADAPCWIAADRAAGARAIVQSGAGVILMDDGLQNSGLAQDLRIIVVDGATGFGNGLGIPAGPLRERIAPGLARGHAAVLMGDDLRGSLPLIERYLPVLRARLTPSQRERKGERVVGFAGIGRPEKFRATLDEAGFAVAGFHAFPDHHPYNQSDLERLAAEAERLQAKLVTTEKDWMRLDQSWRTRILPIAVELVWDEPAAPDRLLDRLARHG